MASLEEMMRAYKQQQAGTATGSASNYGMYGGMMDQGFGMVDAFGANRPSSPSQFGQESGLGNALGTLGGAMPAVDPATMAIKGALHGAGGIADLATYFASDIDSVNLGAVNPYYMQSQVDVPGMMADKEAMGTNAGTALRAGAKGAASGAALGMFAGPVGAAVGGAIGGVGGAIGGAFKSAEEKRAYDDEISRAEDAHLAATQKYEDYQMGMEADAARRQQLQMRQGMPPLGTNIYSYGR